MNFMDFGMAVDLMFYYDEYVDECKEKGTNPVDFKTWYNNMEDY